ncbi:F-box/FBD/LRR-repeat protein [Raphanus sativus]|nr:F-box/FBD/LRR-repeat protein [Raphanus sativus]
MTCSSRYFHLLQRPKSPWLRAFCRNDGCRFGQWCQDSLLKTNGLILWTAVRIAVDRFVRDLKISFTDGVHRFIRLPSRLFRCETLETLELHKVIFLDVPRRVSLKSLRTLRLRAVKYADEESFVRLISSSPVLENLVVHSCSDDNVETFTIDVPSLRSLTVWNTLQDSDDPDNNLFVLQHPHSLNHLDIVNEYGEVNVMGEMPELVEASLNTFATRGNAWESLAFAKRLSLTLYGLDPVGSIFFQLVRLEFRGCNENWSNLLMHVLRHSPVLQIVKLFDCDLVCWIQPSCVPECLLFHLKTFEWIDYTGKEDDKEVAVYILKSARRLETATVFPESFMMNKRRVFAELEIATRGSRAYHGTTKLHSSVNVILSDHTTVRVRGIEILERPENDPEKAQLMEQLFQQEVTTDYACNA